MHTYLPRHGTCTCVVFVLLCLLLLLLLCVISAVFNPLKGTGNYSATSNNMKLVHWPLMGGLLHLVWRGGDWAGPQPAKAQLAVSNVTSPSINRQCTNHRITL